MAGYDHEHYRECQGTKLDAPNALWSRCIREIMAKFDISDELADRPPNFESKPRHLAMGMRFWY